MLRAATRACSCHTSLRLFGVQNVKQPSVVASRFSPRRYSTPPPRALSRPGRNQSHLPVPPFIENLNPHHIVPQDYVDLSSQTFPRVYFNRADLANNLPPSKIPYPVGDRRSRFPDDCKGFFYFYEDPGKRPNMSGLRFRIADEATQHGFDAGKDLPAYGTARPYTLSLLRMQRGEHRDYVEGILRRLKADDLFDWDVLLRWVKALEPVPGTKARWLSSKSRLLPTLDTPFEIELSEGLRYYYILDELDEQQPRLIGFNLCPQQMRTGHPRPYKGRCLIRLEMLDEVIPSVGTALSFHIRVLKFLTPLKSVQPGYNGFEKPEEGSLLYRNQQPLVRTTKLCLPSHRREIPSLSASKRDNKDPISEAPSPHGRHVSTLDPTKLQPQEYIDLSGSVKMRLFTHARALNEKHLAITPRYLAGYNRSFDVQVPRHSKQWPAGTHGFFYFHHDPALPLLSAAVRFRVTPNASEEGFRSGRDLLIPGKDRPWQLPLLQMVNTERYKALIAQLMEDGLVTEEVIDRCRRIAQASSLPNPLLSIVLWQPEQAFEASFHIAAPSLFVIDAEECTIHIPSASTSLPVRKHDWSHLAAGKCRFRLELLPDMSRSGLQQYHLRLLEILEPIEADSVSTGASIPKEGSLLTRRGVPVVLRLRPAVDRRTTNIAQEAD